MVDRSVFILDDNDEFRESTAFLLEAMGYTVNHFSAHEETLLAMQPVPKESAACLLLDIRMPDISGLDVHDEILKRHIDIPVIYMTAHGDVPLAVSAMRKGAVTFLEKPLDDDALVAALEQALSPEVQSRRHSAAEWEELAEAQKIYSKLTKRELQVLRCIVREMSNKEIAAELFISVKTVESHRSKCMRKFNAKNAAHLIRLVLASESSKAA